MIKTVLRSDYPPVTGLEPADNGTTGALASCAAARAPNAADVERFSRLVDLHFDFIWRLLRRLGVPQSDADDAAQEVFFIASQKLTLIVEGSERAFLFGTALHIKAKAAERRRRISELERMAADNPPPSALAVDELVERRRARELLDEILESMPLELRIVFVLFELEELTTAEIAELLGVPQGTAASRLRRAREDFQARIDRINARSRFTRRKMK